jgi:SPP1 gp7 family putative phage head morphogenesis protein
MSLNKGLFDSSVEIHLDAEMAAASADKTIVKLLQNLEKELTAKLQKGVTEWSKARIIEQLNEAKVVIHQYYGDIENVSNDVTDNVSKAAAKATASSLSVAVGGQVPIKVVPPADYLKTLASNTIVQGAVQKEWWSSQAKDTASGFQTAVRQGLVAAETTPQIVKRVRGVMDISKRSAKTLVHTSVQSVANTAREKIFEDNGDVMSGKEWSAALDRRTCPTCGVRDGKRWTIDNKPINHGIPYTIPPQHFQCRCSMIPVLKTWKELGINMDELPDSTRASMDGQVTDKTFEDWLKRKTEKNPNFANDLLGKGRSQLWKDGKITFDQMISGGKELTLGDLQKKYKLTLDDQHKQTLIDIASGKATFEQNALNQLKKQGKLDGLTAQQQVEAINSHTQVLKDNKAIQAKLNSYKKNVLAGKEPTVAQKAALDGISQSEKDIFMAKLEKAKPVIKDEFSSINMNDLEKVGAQSGSNEGGLYRNKKTGEKFYIKFPESEASARNEVLAGKLYQQAGVENVSKTHLIKLDNGNVGIASEYIEGLKIDREALINSEVAGVNEGFAADAWLANWDVAGLSYDNLLVKNGVAYRIDAGGALEFRAMAGSGKKGALFGDTVGELKTLLNEVRNPQSATVFKHLTDDEIVAGIRKINLITDAELADSINLYAAGTQAEKTALFDKMIARREFLNAEYPEARSLLKKIEPIRPVRDTKAAGVQVEQARINGYSVLTDKGMIEDHNVVFAEMTDTNGRKFTRMWMKLTPEGMKAIEIGSPNEFGFRKVMFESKNKDYYYTRSAFDKSNATVSDIKEHIPQSWHRVYANKDNGLEAVYFPAGQDTNFSLQGVVQVDIDGSAVKGLNKGFQFISDIGIDAEQTTKAALEELYLDQIAYIRNTNNSVQQRTWRRITQEAAGNEAQRIIDKRAFLSVDMNVKDITKLPEYKPEGTYQAFDHGRKRTYRPDLDAAEFKAFADNHYLYNNPCALSKVGDGIDDTNLLDSIKSVINGGGQICSQVDRVRRGVMLTQEVSDFGSGGANYVFTRVKSVYHSNTQAGLYWKADHIKRTDAIAYKFDEFGRVTGNNIDSKRQTTVAQYTNMASQGSDEVIFKDGLSYFEGLAKIVFPSKDGAFLAKRWLSENGYKVWTDGRSLDDVIRYIGQQ